MRKASPPRTAAPPCKSQRLRPDRSPPAHDEHGRLALSCAELSQGIIGPLPQQMDESRMDAQGPSRDEVSVRMILANLGQGQRNIVLDVPGRKQQQGQHDDLARPGSTIGESFSQRRFGQLDVAVRDLEIGQPFPQRSDDRFELRVRLGVSAAMTDDKDGRLVHNRPRDECESTWVDYRVPRQRANLLEISEKAIAAG